MCIRDRISREDIGLVITDEGKDDLVLCPASWFNLDYVDDFSLSLIHISPSFSTR